MFGGQEYYEDRGLSNKESQPIREKLSDVRIINTETQDWRIMRTSGDFIGPRRSHTACQLGKHMLVHGGIDNAEKMLNNFMMLDLGEIV